MAADVVLYLVLMLPGFAPAEHYEPMPNIEACMGAVSRALIKWTEQPRTGQFQVTCVVTSPAMVPG